MASIVTLESMEELENTLNVHLGLTQLQIQDIEVDSDSTKFFLQGRIKNIGVLVKHAKAPLFYRKFTIEEDETQDQMNVMLTVEEKLSEQYQVLKSDTIGLGDLLVVVNARIELDPLFPTHGGAYIYQAIVDVSSPDCKVLLLKGSHDSSGKSRKHPEKESAASTIVNRTIPNPKSQKKEPYVYVKINSLVSSMTVNVFGVVKFVKDPCKTRGLDYSMVITLMDESANTSDDKLKCVLFGNVSKLPSTRPGHIIRFHRLKIATFKNELQGQNGPGFSWVVFDGLKDASLSPIGTSHENSTITEEDQERVRQLRLWAASEMSVLSSDRHSSYSLSGITTGQYFDLTCQVVGTCVVIEGESVLLKVWDGTRVKLKLYEQDMMCSNISSRLCIDNRLAKCVSHYLVDVWVFDDHFARAMEVKPGDFIKLQNLHALRHKPRPDEEADPDSVCVELCLHGGSSYGRRLTILDPTSKDVSELRQALDRELAAAATDDSADSINQLWSEAWAAPLDVHSSGNGNRSVPNENAECVSHSDDQVEFFTPQSQPEPVRSPCQFNRSANAPVNDIGSGAVAGTQHQVVVVDSSGSSSKESAQKHSNVVAQKRSNVVSDELTVKRLRHDNSAGHENDVDSGGNENGFEKDIAVRVEKTLSSSENTIAQSVEKTLLSSGEDVAVNGQKEESAEKKATRAGVLHSPSSLGFTRDRCMLDTATVITGHHHIKVTAAEDIRKHTPPDKFRFQGYAVNYQPKSETVSDFLRLYCDRCRFLSSIPCARAGDQPESLELSETRRIPIFKRTEDEIEFYCCPECNGEMEYIFMMEFILNDGTGWIHVGMWRQQANKFFGCSPVDLLRNPNRYHEIVKKLNMMCCGQSVIRDVQNAEDVNLILFEPQKMECCLLSYRSPCGISYQIFDTTFAVDS